MECGGGAVIGGDKPAGDVIALSFKGPAQVTRGDLIEQRHWSPPANASFVDAYPLTQVDTTHGRCPIFDDYTP